MHLQISSDRLELTDKVRKIVRTKFTPKLDQLLSRFNDELKTGILHIRREKLGEYETKFDIQLPGKDGNIFAKNRHLDLVASLTGLREEIEKQIKKYKQHHSPTSLS